MASSLKIVPGGVVLADQIGAKLGRNKLELDPETSHSRVLAHANFDFVSG